MSAQRINELGSEIRQLHVEIVEKKGVGTYELTNRFTARLLDLINTALEADAMVDKVLNLLEKSGAKTTVK